MADALVRAATDDDLVDRAAQINRLTVEKRWNAASNAKTLAAHLVKLARSS